MSTNHLNFPLCDWSNYQTSSAVSYITDILHITSIVFSKALALNIPCSSEGNSLNLTLQITASFSNEEWTWNASIHIYRLFLIT